MHASDPSAPFDLCGRSLFTADQWRAIAASLELSPRELEVAYRMFDGHNDAATAQELGISTHTVHAHVKRLYRKLGVHDRCELLIRIFAAHMSLDSAGRAGRRKGPGRTGRREVPVPLSPDQVAPE